MRLSWVRGCSAKKAAGNTALANSYRNHLRNSYKFTLPFPPSVNSMFHQRGGQQKFKSKGYKEWLISCPKLDKINLIGPVQVNYKFFWPCNRARDLSNYTKAAEDFLVSQGVLMDDNWKVVQSITLDTGGVVKKHEARVEIEIHELP